MKIIGWLIGGAAALGSAGYLLVYIVRWQWNRALFSGMALVLVCLIMATALLLQRISDLSESVADLGGGRDNFRQDLEATRPHRDHFAWLRETSQHTNVFITVLLGGGAIISGIAWAVGKVAESTTTPDAESRLSERMGSLAFPDRGLAPSSDPGTDPALMLLRGPAGRATERAS